MGVAEGGQGVPGAAQVADLPSQPHGAAVVRDGLAEPLQAAAGVAEAVQGPGLARASPTPTNVSRAAVNRSADSSNSQRLWLA